MNRYDEYLGMHGFPPYRPKKQKMSPFDLFAFILAIFAIIITIAAIIVTLS